MENRTWYYLLPPAQFEVFCSKCEGSNTWWSEYEKHIWCYDCEIDDPGTSGVFDGPIPMKLSVMMGIHFDRYNMKIDEIELFDFRNNRYVPLSILIKQLSNPSLAKDMLQGGNIKEHTLECFGETVFSRIEQYKELMNDA